MTADDAYTMIDLGENLNVEFKAKLSSTNAKAICKEIAALAATTGGHLFVGVADNGHIVGLENALDIRDKLERWSAELIVPPPVINPTIVEVAGLEILVVEVANGTAPLYSFDDRFYIRVGTSSVTLDAAKIIDVVRGRRIEDVIASMESTIAVANSTALAAMYATAPAIQGQGDLATMNYHQLRDRVFSEMRQSPAFAALETGVAVAQSTASMALASPSSIVANREGAAQDEYNTLLARLIGDIESSNVIRMIQTSASVAQSSSIYAQSLVSQMQTALAEIRTLVDQLRTETSSLASSTSSNSAHISYIESKTLQHAMEIKGISDRLNLLRTI